LLRFVRSGLAPLLALKGYARLPRRETKRFTHRQCPTGKERIEAFSFLFSPYTMKRFIICAALLLAAIFAIFASLTSMAQAPSAPFLVLTEDLDDALPKGHQEYHGHGNARFFQLLAERTAEGAIAIISVGDSIYAISHASILYPAGEEGFNWPMYNVVFSHVVRDSVNANRFNIGAPMVDTMEYRTYGKNVTNYIPAGMETPRLRIIAYEERTYGWFYRLRHPFRAATYMVESNNDLTAFWRVYLETEDDALLPASILWTNQ